MLTQVYNNGNKIAIGDTKFFYFFKENVPKMVVVWHKSRILGAFVEPIT